jgi:DNA-binding IclR family transcriptional regulator
MTSDTSPVTTSETTFEIVEYLCDNDDASISEIAVELDRAKSTIHRHLATLVHHGYAVKNGGTYSIGLRFLNLGLSARNNRTLYHETYTKVDQLAEETGEKVWCMTTENGRSVHLYGANGEQAVRTDNREGQVSYLHQHAAGKAILAHLPREHVNEVIERYGLPARTSQTITDSTELFERIEQIREQGYAFNREEFIPGLHAVAVPITTKDNSAIGSLSISGPANRLQGEKLNEDLPNLLLGAVNEIEINLSHS